MEHLPLSQRIEQFQISERKRNQSIFAGGFFLALVAVFSYFTFTGGFNIKAPSTAAKPQLNPTTPTANTTPVSNTPPAGSAVPQGNSQDQNIRSAYSINVLNGTKQNNAHSELTEALKGLGYTVESGKAQYDSYTVLNLGVKEGLDELKAILQADLAKVYPGVQIDEIDAPDDNSTFDAVVVVGTF